jgi:hypothetical protein
MLADLRAYKFVRIFFGVFQKIEAHPLGTLEKSVLESCQESLLLWWDMFSYYYVYE